MSSDKLHCSGCLTEIDNNRYLVCNICKKTFDLFCANVTDECFDGAMTAEYKTVWKCVQCKSKLPRSDNTNTPVRETFEGVMMRRGAATTSPEERLDESSATLPALNLNATAFNETIDISDIQNLVFEIRQCRQEMSAARLQISLLDSTLAALSTRMDVSDKRVDQLSERVASLERQVSEKRTDEHTDRSLLSTIEQLKSELNDRDQDLLLNDVEISCVEEQSGESLPHIAMTLASKLGVKLVEEDLVSAVRVGPRLQQSDTTVSSQSRPRPIVVRLARRALRDQLLKSARVRRGATTEDTGLQGPSRRFYINERLTKVNRQLFRRARELAGKLNWRYVWTRDGRIYARQHQGTEAPRLRIRTESDLERVFGSLAVGAPEAKK